MSLHARNITVRLGRRDVLSGVDFTAQPGALTAIVGPNGSGKTTLLRALVGEIGASGDVRLNGLQTASAKPWALAAMRGVLPQAASLAFPFTVIEVITMGLEAGRHAARRTLPLQALQKVGLSGYEDRYYQELSGGEQQRVQLARVLCQVWEPVSAEGPCWLFLDEPVSSLDIGHQLGIMRIAADYAARGGGVIAVMHDLNLTAMFADQVALLKGGAIRAVGTPRQVLTDTNLSEAYDCAVRVNTAPAADNTFILPHAAQM
ncbi:heme ABC transporter ATP-binding protein [Dinoroseobacter sp. PD6]|uniref:heme ABC transporter ATP-binding protein n=1 Tax=Dinoroseobacter sp. PD6 TaxID=3028384 RepID=UPI00237BFCC0|nr:heme ABC transporter ATP-binding protein [Dinoroseobacter sp. PD6]MDD9717524.1 heme ABC transporter ATP-binding protein [Dinoroseobacter sp. PD6]